ncbi:MAG: NADPH-dependent 7-cyano-7-deazaguanine reductase QueF [Bdellovibrionales bacterium]|nr:NADPH-dependent 7-cyano-7-deazaguanine reductase QueF [Bdellovibrionales bacterium]
MAVAEGKRIPFESEDKIDAAVLESFPYEGPRQRITCTTNEFSAVCPYSGLPDIATIVVDYIPAQKCIELKSLKYYFLSYRNVGIYQEPATSRIYTDLFRALEPAELNITVTYQTRGGIDTTTRISSADQKR